MEVNGKNIKGIFKYSGDVKYTEGDFVVEGDMLYTCLEASTGYLPSISPDKFKPYLGAPTTGEIEDSSISYVSSFALGKYLSGACNTRGILSNEILSNGEAFFRDFFGNESGLGLGDKYLNPLDNLITSEINQTIVNVSKEVAEPIIGKSNSNPLLKQYTYKTSDTLWTRLQEMVNVDSGDIYFRSSTKFVPIGQSENNCVWSVPSDWKSASVNGAYKTTINQIRSYYTQKCSDLDILKTKLLGAFRFKKVDISSSGAITPPSDMITVCTRYEENGGIYRTDSLTVDLSLLGDRAELKYGIVGDNTLSITKESSPGSYILKTSEGCNICDVYARLSFQYNPQPNPSQVVVSIPVNITANRVAFNTTTILKKTPYIKITINGGRSFVIPADIQNIQITYKAGEIIQVIHHSEFSYSITVSSGILTFTDVEASYVNL